MTYLLRNKEAETFLDPLMMYFTRVLLSIVPSIQLGWGGGGSFELESICCNSRKSVYVIVAFCITLTAHGPLEPFRTKYTWPGKNIKTPMYKRI